MRLLEGIRRQLERDAVLERLAAGASWLALAGVFARGLNFLAYICIARLLGREAFGEFGMLQSSLAMFGVAANFGLGATAARFVARYYECDPLRAGRVIALSRRAILATSLLLAALVYAIAPWFARTQLARASLSSAVEILALSLLFAAINGAQVGVVSGFQAFDRVAHVNVARALIGFPAVLGGVALGGLHGALWGLVATESATCALTAHFVRGIARKHSVPLHPSGLRSELPMVWRFSVPALLSSLLVSPVMWLCNSFVVRLENGYVEMGIFTAANQWRVFVLFLPNILGGLMLPVLSRLGGTGDRSGARRVFLITIGLNVALTSLAGIAICSVAPFSMGIFGQGFGGNVWPLAFLMMSAVMISITYVIDQAIAGAGRMWTVFGLKLFFAVLLVACSLALVPRWGGSGLAAAYALAHVPFTVVMILFYRMRLPR